MKKGRRLVAACRSRSDADRLLACAAFTWRCVCCAYLGLSNAVVKEGKVGEIHFGSVHVSQKHILKR